MHVRRDGQSGNVDSTFTIVAPPSMDIAPILLGVRVGALEDAVGAKGHSPPVSGDRLGTGHRTVVAPS